MNAKWTLRVVLLSAVLLIGVHFVTLDNPLLAPDTKAVVENYYLGDPGKALRLFISSHGAGERAQEGYEPAAGLSVALDRSLWGDDPRGLRVVSLVLHLITTALLFLIMTRFGVAPLWAAMGALVFAVHPLHTQAIEMISSRGHLLSSALTFAAMLVFSGPVFRVAGGTRVNRPRGSWVALGLFVIGLFSGLEALTFVPFCCLLPVALGVRYPNWRFYAILGSAVVIYAVMAIAAVGFRALGLSESYWGAASAVKGLALVVAPAGQMLYHPVDFVHSWADGRALVGLGMALALAASAAALRSRARALAMALGFTACALLAFFLYGVRAGSLHEPGLYMMAAAACAVAASLAELGSRVRGGRTVFLVLLIVLVAAGAARSWERCGLWADQEKIWLEVLNKNPGNARAIEGLVAYYRESGLTEKAAALVSPESGDALSRAIQLNNEGVAMRDAGRLYESVAKFREAIELWPEFRDAYFNLGVVYQNMRMPDSAASYLEKAIEADPAHADSRYNLGVVFDSVGDYGRAEFEYREALRLDPNHPRALANLGAIRARAGDFQEAVTLLGRAIGIDPGLLEAHFNLALSYEKVDVDKAKEQWRAYLDLARRRGVNPARIRQAEERLQNLK